MHKAGQSRSRWYYLGIPDHVTAVFGVNKCVIVNPSVTLLYDIFTHYGDVIMGVMAFQITSVSIVYSTDCSGSDQRKHQSSASLVFLRGIQRWPVNSPHKGPVILPFDDVIMEFKHQLEVSIFKTLLYGVRLMHMWSRQVFLRRHNSHSPTHII